MDLIGLWSRCRNEGYYHHVMNKQQAALSKCVNSKDIIFHQIGSGKELLHEGKILEIVSQMAVWHIFYENQFGSQGIK